MSEDAQQMNCRERKKAERRERIYQAAIQVFAEKGYRNATIKDIAHLADVGEGTIYSYFDSKEDLLMEIIENLVNMASRRSFAREAMSDSYREVFMHSSRDYMARLGSDFTMYLAVLPEILSTPELRERFYQTMMRPALQIGEQLVRNRTEAGYMRPIDPVLTPRIFHSISLGLSILMIMGDPELHEAMKKHPDKIVDIMATVVFDGLLTRKDET